MSIAITAPGGPSVADLARHPARTSPAAMDTDPARPAQERIWRAAFALSPDRTLETLRGRVAAIGRRLDDFPLADPEKNSGGLPGVLNEARTLHVLRARLESALALCESLADGDADAEYVEPAGPAAFDADLVRIAVLASTPNLARRMVDSARATAAKDERDLAQKDAAIAGFERSLASADGGMDAMKFDEEAMYELAGRRRNATAAEDDLVGGRDELQRRRDRRRAALDDFEARLPAVFAKAVEQIGGAEAVAADLAEARALSRELMAGVDPECKALSDRVAALDGEIGRLDAEGAAGRVREQLEAEKKSAEAALRARHDARREAALGAIRDDVARVAGGSLEAWEGLARAARTQPRAFTENAAASLAAAVTSALIDGGHAGMWAEMLLNL